MARPKIREFAGASSSDRGFGELFERILRYHFEAGGTEETYGQFVTRLSNDVRLSPRQFARLRTGEATPEFRVLRQLAKKLPELGSMANNLIHSIRLDWPAMAFEQNLLPEYSTVTLVLGDIAPRALYHSQNSSDTTNEHARQESEAMAKALATNITQKQISYALVYPVATPENVGWFSRLKKLVLRYSMETLPEFPMEEDVLTRHRVVQESVRLFFTRPTNASLSFWARAPRYSSLSNLNAPQLSKCSDFQYGMFWESGDLPYPNIRQSQNVPGPIEVSGWTYFSKDDFATIRSLFRAVQDEGSLTPGEHGKPFPIPGPPVLSTPKKKRR